MEGLRVVLAEDHHIVRDGIRLLLGQEKSIKVVGEATNGTQVIELLDEGLEVDVILADLNMPEMDGMTLIKTLKIRYPKVNIVILSMLDQQKYVFEAFSEGVMGYLLKSVGLEELLFALRQAKNGQKYLCAELGLQYLEEIFHRPGRFSEYLDQTPLELSPREVEVLHFIGEGLTNNEIADQLFISKRTVEGHRQTLIEKTRVRNTASLIRYAVVNGYLK
ncbi:response regulator transcription factor [Pedobacter sp. PLR]|uniref:response regulator transcription factor n=1 Tax=Pedobacter sp. PLR TaxID=2994465 RepID=UPI0022480C82|nr:response regulator transcription factor [Pedobacter sp. PLR]MCX2453449.1 response regulator transcription factor [Pedobacter sp. PLR]